MGLLLGGGRAAGGASPQSTLGEQIMKIDQGRYRNLRRTRFHANTGHRIQHPRRDGDNNARRGLDMRKGTGLSSLDVMLPQAATMKRMPAVVNDNFLPDMGRMSG
jgi:hypothetical protein